MYFYHEVTCTHLLVVIVGFEETMYSVNEAAGVLEVCVVITNPTQNEDLLLEIVLLYNSVTGTAGKFKRLILELLH